MPLSTAQANTLLDALLVSNAWLALSTADPLADGSGLAEPAGGSYARVDIHAKFAAAAARSKVSNADIVFATATAGWGNIGWFAIMDASTVGNLKWKGQVTGGVVNNTDIVKWLSGQFAIGFS